MSSGMRWAADRRLGQAEARIHELEEALGSLEKAEADYRRLQDLFGGSERVTARAWDQMRCCGDHARFVLTRRPAKLPSSPSGSHEPCS